MLLLNDDFTFNSELREKITKGEFKISPSSNMKFKNSFLSFASSLINGNCDTRYLALDMIFSILDRLIALHGLEKLREKIETQ